jgi:hypothetical protein
MFDILVNLLCRHVLGGQDIHRSGRESKQGKSAAA